MARVVNYAGTVLGLNTDRFRRSLRTIRSDVGSLVNSVTSSFKGLVGGFVALAGIKGSFDKITGSLKDMERTVSSLSAITGSISGAKALFQDLNNLSRELPQDFQDITKSAVALNKSGIAPTKENIKAISAIAVGTEQSMVSVAQTLSNAMLGRLKSLQQLGIQATQIGDKIEVSFKGQKETIDATNTALMDYVRRLSASNFAETLDYQMQGMTGATKRLGDAWGDLWLAIADSDVGKQIASSIEESVKALDRLSEWIKSIEGQQVLGSLVRAFNGAFSTISNAIHNLWDPFKDFFKNLSDSGEETCKAEIGYFEGWFDFVRLGLGDLAGLLDTWFKKVQLYAERAGSLLYQSVHGTTREISMRADMQVKMLEKIKELGLENTPLLNPRTQKVDLSQILQLPTEHPLRQFYDSQRKIVAESNEGLQEDELQSADAFQQKLKDIEDKNHKDRNEKYDELITSRLKTIENLNSKTIAGYKDVEMQIGKTGKTGSSASRSMSKLKDTTDQARRSYEQLVGEIQRIQFNQLDNIEQEKIRYSERLEILKNALNNQIISSNEYRALEEQLTDLHLQKLSELYADHYQKEADKRQDILDQIRQQEEDWNADTNTDSLGRFTKKLEKYGLTWNNLIQANFDNSKLTARQIAGVYSQASGAMSDYFGSIASGFDQTSGTYKTLFALQKSFAVASSLMSVYQGVANAMAAPFPMNLVAWMQVLAQGMGIIAQIKSINYTGAHDRGGYIPAGSFGLAGEIGPELIKGPATVISRQQTSGMIGGSDNIVINLIEDRSRAGNVDQYDNDEERIINIFVSNIRTGGASASAMESVYGLKRVGY